MKTIIVYTLVSDENDYYYEQALMSLHSLRLYHPSSTVVNLVVDGTTHKSLVGKRDEIKKYVDQIISIQVPEKYNKKQASRYLKTHLRQFISGDYLFIDCDTIICKSLSSIDNTNASLAMVADINGDLYLKDEKNIERCISAGFENLEGKPYFNSGVIFAKDTPEVHHFYNEWHKNWKLSVEKGIDFDQPALCKTNADVGLMIKELPGIWNCQFKYMNGYKLLRCSSVLHYYSNNIQRKQSFVQKRLFDYIKEKGKIDQVVNKMILHSKTTLYTVMTINDDKAFEFYNSEMIYTFFNVPKAYRIACSIAKLLEQPLIFISKLFTNTK